MEDRRLEKPVLAVDVAVFGLRDGRLHVLLHRRVNPPFDGALALPGVAVRADETLEAAARRALREKPDWPPTTGASVYLEQLATFDALYRDPRGRTVSVAYLGIVRSSDDPRGGADWLAVKERLPGGLPFDHDHILQTATARLAGKLRYTSIAREFLPSGFRIETLQAVYEAVLDRRLNRTNFRNKLMKIGMIEKVSVLTAAVGKKGGRPPHLYRFRGSGVEAVDRDFL